ncbi:breast cancer type 1 susceptibility protein homolog isoform X1 [Takifugu flavidus]|uniref:breast cancer type 1 susceptibility protein homolog isoform X1 n=2 Tax=Takifugu flavidus TaxID=433684 RepID=UPI002544A224|nr:breast cancer type 1 susceptibility protein homolog isoform X1 [Takifugu flavidus]
MLNKGEEDFSCGKTEACHFWNCTLHLRENKDIKIITMEAAKAADVKKGISVLWESLQCPICLDILTAPVSTKCDHQFCKFCISKLLSNTKQNKANCPVCKSKITKRSLQESPKFQRLVTGLQGMILAYENDTGTNYFTGLSRQTQQPHVADIKNAQHHKEQSDENASRMEDDNEDLPKSYSSTRAAQDGFARLMGLEDTSPLTTEIDGLDSGLGEAPPTCDKKMYSPRKLEKVSFQPALIPDKDEHPHLQTPSKKKHKKVLEPDKILDQKQKKSLEKVAEWLMKVPSEQSLELENLDEDGDDSDSCSSTSTIDLGLLHCESNPMRARGKALEDQVFGAIYKRQRRGKGIVKPIEAALEMVCLNHSDKNTSEDKSREDKEEVHSIRAQEQNTSSNILKEEIAVLEDCGGIVEPTHMSENDQNNKDEVPHLVSDIGQQQPETIAKRTRSSLQQVDCDLLKCTQKKPEDSGKKKIAQRGSKGIKSEKSKSARMSKPLVLVTVEKLDTSPKIRPQSEKVEVHIENYPSSGDQEVPLGRCTRKSRRLQVFTKEDDKKETSRFNVPEKQHNSKYPNFECEILDNIKSQNCKYQTQQANRNGCIYNQGIQEIENMDSGERASSLRSEEDTKTSLSEVQNTEILSETPRCVAVFPSCAELAPAEPTNQPPNTVQLVTELAEKEREQQNDSEQDTEQLVRSFKATKRKSFHLGTGPNMKRSHLLVHENTQSPGTEENENYYESLPKQVQPVMAKITNSQVLIDSQNMSGSDLISPSCSPSLTRKALGLQSRCSVEVGNCVLGNSASSPLSPNNESKHVVQSSSPLILTKGNSTICFATEKPSQISESKTDFIMMKETRGNTSLHSFNGSTAEELLDAQSSLTPDGLGMPVPEVTYSQGSRELSRCRKRTKSQKLDSSSDCTEEEFPCFSKILNKTAPPGANPPASPSLDCVNSSQASVDLFDMPNECAINNVESSQFSSEVLVTQQKIEMKKELVRLEKLMALVTEVLHEKETSPAKNIQNKTNLSSKITGSDADKLRPNVQDEDFNQETFPEEALEPNTRYSDAPPSGSKHSRTTEMNSRTSNTVGLSSAAKTDGSPSAGHEDKENNKPEGDRSQAKMLLVTSGLGASEQITVKKFAKRIGAVVVSQVTPEVTHIVMHTDEQLVCERTLKYFLGIAGRKWVVSFQWISECFKQKKLLNESSFEVRGDVVNGSNHQGPMKARTTGDNNLLMKDFNICFQGPFTDMTTAEMELMVELCGATVVKDPLLLHSKPTHHQLIIVQSGSESYKSLSRKATVVTRGWLLDTVATYTIQNFRTYRADLRAA